MRLVRITKDFEIVDAPVMLMVADLRPYANGYVYDDGIKSSADAAAELLDFHIAECNKQTEYWQNCELKYEALLCVL